MYKDEYPDSWDDFGLQPIRAVKQCLARSGVEVPFHNVWGRSFKDGDRKTNPKSATSMQFHILADAEQELTLLRTSGSNGIYISPKQDNKPKKGFRVIWLGPDKQNAQIQSARLDAQCGLVRSRSSFGVRVSANVFDEAYGKIFPDKVPPELVQINKVYRIRALPRGKTAQTIKSWAAGLNWHVRVINLLGPTGCILGAESPPPEASLIMDDSLLLVEEIQQPNKGPIIAAAGARKFHRDNQTNPDPWFAGQDPWAAAKKVDLRPPLPRRPPAATAVASSVEDQVKQRASELGEIRQAIKSIQSVQESNAASSSSQIGQLRQDTRQLIEETQNKSWSDMRNFVSDCMSKQSTKSSSDELKELIIAHSRAPQRAKKQREYSDSEM